MKVDESGKTKFTPDKWAAKLVSERSGPNGCDAVIDINPPATVAIGEWSLIVDTKTKLDKKTKIYRYEHPDDIYMLFNPWCKGKEYIKWAAARQNQQNDLCTQWKLRTAWASAQTDQSLRCSHE